MKRQEFAAWIEQHGLSQRQTAEALGVQREAVARWLSGARKMPGRMLDLALRCLELRPSLLDPDNDPMPKD